MNDPDMIRKAQNGDEGALDALVRENTGLVKSIAYRFRDRGTEQEDITQIGIIGLIKAIRNFDLDYGTKFSTYAVPLIMGEIKKYLRDDGIIKVGREVKKNGAVLSRVREEYYSEHGREPRISEIAELCGMNVEDAVSALDATSSVISFSDTIGDTPLEDFLGNDNISPLVESISLRQAITTLSEQEREIIYNRYFRGYSQSKVASMCGMTQVKVSRTEKKIMDKLKKELA